MSLDVREKTAVDLRLTGALYLEDLESGLAQADQEKVRAALRLLHACADEALVFVWDGKSAKSLVQGASSAIWKFSNDGTLSPVVSAVAALDRIAATNCGCTGDYAPSAPQCGCGVQGLALAVETEVRRVYTEALRNPLVRDVSYQTYLVDTARLFPTISDCGLDATTDITSNPAVVHIEIKDRALSSSDICQLAYILFHELICHAFQAGRIVQITKNAHAKCFWTEGWMDALAFELVSKWIAVGNASEWLPFTGPCATDAISSYHRDRYQRPIGLDDQAARDRRFARKSYWKLKQVLLECGLVPDVYEASLLAQRFSLCLNAHPGASTDRLRKICDSLMIGLSTEKGSSEPASRCIDFINYNDISLLEDGLRRYAV